MPALLLHDGRRRIVGQLVFAGIGALDFELVEKQRRANDRCSDSPGSVADQRVVADSNQVAAQRADIELVENGATNQLFVSVGINAIEKPRRVAGSKRFDG